MLPTVGAALLANSRATRILGSSRDCGCERPSASSAASPGAERQPRATPSALHQRFLLPNRWETETGNTSPHPLSSFDHGDRRSHPHGAAVARSP